MQVTTHIVNAFTVNNTGGNPAGVVLNANDLSHQQKLSIANRINLSETAFVSDSDTADFKLEFFTPTRQIAHCGHATIATFGLLKERGLVKDNTHSSKETIDGNRDIILNSGMIYMQQAQPKITFLDSLHNEIYASLGVTELQVNSKPLLINTGNNFIVLGVKSRLELMHLKPNLESINAISEKLDLIGYYIYSQDTFQPESSATTRMFAPRYGISEEAATGMAAGPLACHLYNLTQKESYLIEQGYLMTKPSPSQIKVNLNLVDKKINSVLAGGYATLKNSKTIEI